MDGQKIYEKKITIIDKTVTKRIPFLQGISLINWCFCFHKCKLQNMVTSIFNNWHDLVRICYGIQETHFTNSWTIFFIWCFCKLKNMLWLKKKGDAANCLPFGIHTSNIKQRTKQTPMECYNMTHNDIKVSRHYK